MINPEGKLQAKIIIWLKEQGAYVVKNRAGPGVPVGCPDLFFFYDGAWGAIEAKRDEKAPYRVGQQKTLKRLEKWSPFVYTAYPENWPDVQKILLEQFF